MTVQAALVTGSSRGIGLAAAVELAKAGFNVAVNSRTSGGPLDQAAELVGKAGVKVCRVAMDARELSRRRDEFDRIEDEIGPLTTLVNNAGIGVINRGDVLDVSEESYDRCMEVNAKAMFFLCQEFARRLLGRTQEPGLHYSLINVTSANAVAVALPRSEYCASKAAAAMISRVFAARLGERGIPVIDVQPGLISTDMTKTVIDEYSRRAADGLCLYPRVGQPEEVAGVIAAVATGRIPYTTGQAISVDGGMLVPRF